MTYILSWVIFAALWVLLATLVGAWAISWNRSPLLWCFVATFFSPVLAAIFLLVAGDAKPTCPFCKEKVQPEANLCKHCGRELKDEG